PNRPVVHVKWYEAVAYCNWLTDKLRSVAPRGRYRLPTEAEWEYAARGEGRRLWPWGDDPPLIAENVATRCNAWIGDNYAASTTPVGIYPLGRTPEGIDELAGNVWEWCSSLYQSYPYSANDGRE
ncbi:MAG: formylglycine-generating enzyme family protein, partial [Armatimonadetes bacterium]|nr:formylglycine-generating enzyme family protein [Armatimonadota bacterium]